MIENETMIEYLKKQIPRLPMAFAEHPPLHLMPYHVMSEMPDNSIPGLVEFEFESEVFCATALRYCTKQSERIAELLWRLKEQFDAGVAKLADERSKATGQNQFIVITDREKFYGQWYFIQQSDPDLFKYVAKSTIVFADLDPNF